MVGPDPTISGQWGTLKNQQFQRRTKLQEMVGSGPTMTRACRGRPYAITLVPTLLRKASAIGGVRRSPRDAAAVSVGLEGNSTISTLSAMSSLRSPKFDADQRTQCLGDLIVKKFGVGRYPAHDRRTQAFCLYCGPTYRDGPQIPAIVQRPFGSTLRSTAPSHNFPARPRSPSTSRPPAPERRPAPCRAPKSTGANPATRTPPVRSPLPAIRPASAAGPH